MAGYVLADLRRTIRRPMGSPWDKSAGWRCPRERHNYYFTITRKHVSARSVIYQHKHVEADAVIGHAWPHTYGQPRVTEHE